MRRLLDSAVFQHGRRRTTLSVMRPRFKNVAKRLLGEAFLILQRVGIDVLPRHFYSGIPDIRRLRGSDRWRAPQSMIDVKGSGIDEQAAWLLSLARSAPNDVHERAVDANGAEGFGPVEADCLYAFIRAKQPS